MAISIPSLWAIALVASASSPGLCINSVLNLLAGYLIMEMHCDDSKMCACAVIAMALPSSSMMFQSALTNANESFSLSMPHVGLLARASKNVISILFIMP